MIPDLLNILENDPYPTEHTSSHWEQYGNATTVSLEENGLLLKGQGFGNVNVGEIREQILMKLERLLYWGYTRRLKKYRYVRDIALSLRKDLSFDETFNV